MTEASASVYLILATALPWLQIAKINPFMTGSSRNWSILFLIDPHLLA